jgi:hypothetical protein
MLRILAESAVFLDLPPEELPASAAPDLDAQRRILDLTTEYLTKTLHKMPDYIARQTSTRYEETPQFKWGSLHSEYRPLHLANTLNATIYYRHGAEVAEPEKARDRKTNPRETQLVTYGTFGPILAGVQDAISRHSDLVWSHWEQSASGTVAVFRYAVSPDRSLNQVKVCCLPEGDGKSTFLHDVGYHGEVGIDPRSGAILRLKWSSDLQSTTPIAVSNILIDYGPVEIGGASYICPLRSIAVMRTRSVIDASEWDESYLTYGPYTTWINEIQFSNYRQFRSSVKILPDFNPAAEGK